MAVAALTATTTSEPRRLSNREKARLQGFPDDFVFEHGCGPGGAVQHRSIRECDGRWATLSAASSRGIVRAVAEVLERAGVPARTARDLAAARRRGRSVLTARCDAEPGGGRAMSAANEPLAELPVVAALRKLSVFSADQAGAYREHFAQIAAALATMRERWSQSTSKAGHTAASREP